MRRQTCTAILIAVLTLHAVGDDIVYRYEADVLPYDESAGWSNEPCELPCTESVEVGHLVLRWAVAGDSTFYHYWIAQPPELPPPTLWVEWRFRSNHPIGPLFTGCDGAFHVTYHRVLETVDMYGDAAVSFEGGDYVTGLQLDDFHHYRFESLDGLSYTVAVDGREFIKGGSTTQDNGYNSLQMRDRGGCTGDWIPNQKHEWDFVRYGTISYGEQIVASDPPAGFLDARQHAGLDRFTVTFDEPNYVYVDEITVEMIRFTGSALEARAGADGAGVAISSPLSPSTPSFIPTVIQTRRRDNGAPETVEVVLNRPIPMGATTRFTFGDGVAVNVVEYTFAPGDTDGNGKVDLHDVAALQRCFGQTSLTGVCLALDLSADNTIDLTDWTRLAAMLDAP